MRDERDNRDHHDQLDDGSVSMYSQVREDIGYLKRASEDNTKQIGKFYNLLESHMDEEDKKFESIAERFKAIDKKQTFIASVCILNALAFAEKLPWGEILGMLRLLH